MLNWVLLQIRSKATESGPVGGLAATATPPRPTSNATAAPTEQDNTQSAELQGKPQHAAAWLEVMMPKCPLISPMKEWYSPSSPFSWVVPHCCCCLDGCSRGRKVGDTEIEAGAHRLSQHPAPLDPDNVRCGCTQRERCVDGLGDPRHAVPGAPSASGLLPDLLCPTTLHRASHRRALQRPSRCRRCRPSGCRGPQCTCRSARSPARTLHSLPPQATASRTTCSHDEAC